MEILPLLLLSIAITVFDEAMNGQLQVSRRLLRWVERKSSRDRSSYNSR